MVKKLNSKYQFLFRYMILKYFLSFHGLPFRSVQTQVFNFDKCPTYLFFLFLLELFVSYPKHHCHIQCHEDFSLSFLLREL